MFELFVSKYLSGVPVNKLDKLSALSTIKTIIIETFNLFFFSTNQMSFRGEPNNSLQKIYFHDISLKNYLFPSAERDLPGSHNKVPKVYDLVPSIVIQQIIGSK